MMISCKSEFPKLTQVNVTDQMVRYNRHEYGFLNVERSRKIVHEVWARNQGGQLHMDWLDLLEEYDWEIFVV